MKRHFLVFMAAVCLLSVQNTRGQQMVPAQKISATPAAGTQMTLAQADGIAFRVLSFSEALKRAEVEDKLLFVDCFTTWCGPCKRLSKVVFKDSLVADYFNRHFVNLKMDMEKGEGVELRKKYGVHAYPTLLFINSSGEVVYRLVGAEDAPELLKKVKLGVESGGLSGLKKRYEAGDHYFLVFYYYVHDVNSSAFQYVVNHQKEIADKFPRQGASLDRRLLEDWIAGSYAYLTVDESGHCTFDEQGLDAYVAKMKQMNVAEADMIGESLRLSRDGIMKQWDSFVKRGDKILASHTILGDEGHLLQWVNWLNKECADMSLREKAAQWCDKACEELIKKNEEIKKNLPPGAIPAISMVDHKGQLLQVAEKLRKLMQQS